MVVSEVAEVDLDGGWPFAGLGPDDDPAISPLVDEGELELEGKIRVTPVGKEEGLLTGIPRTDGDQVPVLDVPGPGVPSVYGPPGQIPAVEEGREFIDGRRWRLACRSVCR